MRNSVGRGVAIVIDRDSIPWATAVVRVPRRRDFVGGGALLRPGGGVAPAFQGPKHSVFVMLLYETIFLYV
jgi:hypothetical protein